MATVFRPVTRCLRVGRIIFASLFLTLVCASSAHAQTVVTFTFDDGIETQLTAASNLESHGMRGTFYINSGKLESETYFMTWPQVDGLSAAGHEIAGHTIDHKRLTNLTPDEQRRQVCDDVATLRGRGYNITDFAYPYGAGTTAPAVQQALRDCGYVSARQVGGLRSDADCANCPFAESLPPANRFAIKSSPAVTAPISLADLQGWVTQVEQNGGGWLPLLFHEICDNCGDGTVSPQNFSLFTDWLSQRSTQGTIVKTVRQALAEGPQYPPPTTAISCNATACPSGFLKAPVTISLLATDVGGGV